MTFADIVNRVLVARFTEAQRPNCKDWVNIRYGWLWAAEDWAFKQDAVNVTATSGSRTLSSVPAGFEAVKALFMSDGLQLQHLTPMMFYTLYQGDTSTGSPCHYTVVNGTISVAPTPQVTDAAVKLLYTKGLTVLSADGDIPAFPAAHHPLLVNGAMAHGLAEENDFTSDFHESLWQQGLQMMASEFVADDLSTGNQWGSAALGDYY